MLAVTVNHYLVLSGLVFSISLVGMMLHRKNMMVLLMCAELLLLAVNTNLVAFSRLYHDIHGEIMVFFILTVAAAEAAIGLALVVLFYRQRQHIEIDRMNHLRG